MRRSFSYGDAVKLLGGDTGLVKLLDHVSAATVPATGGIDLLDARTEVVRVGKIRVVLRDVAADTTVQDQVEAAVTHATGERLTWPDLVRAAGPATPVTLLDGFDELLQATGTSKSDYLTRVREFQQREAAQGRAVIVVVTTRIAVANRARPAGRPWC